MSGNDCDAVGDVLGPHWLTKNSHRAAPGAELKVTSLLDPLFIARLACEIPSNRQGTVEETTTVECGVSAIGAGTKWQWRRLMAVQGGRKSSWETKLGENRGFSQDVSWP